MINDNSVTDGLEDIQEEDEEEDVYDLEEEEEEEDEEDNEEEEEEEENENDKDSDIDSKENFNVAGKGQERVRKKEINCTLNQTYGRSHIVCNEKEELIGETDFDAGYECSIDEISCGRILQGNYSERKSLYPNHVNTCFQSVGHFLSKGVYAQGLSFEGET